MVKSLLQRIRSLEKQIYQSTKKHLSRDLQFDRSMKLSVLRKQFATRRKIKLWAADKSLETNDED